VVGDTVSPSNPNAPHRTQLTIRRRLQFSSALKRMATISSLPGGKLVVAVKGAPETIKGMLKNVPDEYDDTYKWFTMRGSRVLALGIKDMEALTVEKVCSLLLNDATMFTLTTEGQQAPPRRGGMQSELCRLPGLQFSAQNRRHRNPQDAC
jgi:magnesium-transporting ATPase (P-type)